ncbi:GntR family transcriptional regulator [Spirillospora sp. CA-255316]
MSETSARERAYRYLRQAIVSGELREGTRIVEERIAETLGLSRTPVREALQRLGTEGLIVRVRRGHLEVTTVGDEERTELHLLRIAVDEVAARLLTRKRDKIVWADLYALLEPLGEAARVHGIHSPPYAVAHLDLHLAINKAAFSQRTAVVLAGGAGPAPTDDYVQQDGYDPVEQHRALLDALSSGDDDHAVTAALAHALRGRPADLSRPSGLLGSVERPAP